MRNKTILLILTLIILNNGYSQIKKFGKVSLQEFEKNEEEKGVTYFLWGLGKKFV